MRHQDSMIHPSRNPTQHVPCVWVGVSMQLGGLQEQEQEQEQEQQDGRQALRMNVEDREEGALIF